MNFKWVEKPDCFYYFVEDTGMIVGMVHKIAHSDIYVSKIVERNEETVLGRFIDGAFAKESIQSYWYKESRTLLE